MGLLTAAVAYRLMIASDLSGGPDSLDNINTSPLPDGTNVFVVSEGRLWVLKKFSTKAGSPDTILVPAAGGPGRWFRASETLGAAPFLVRGNAQNSIDSTSGTTWLEPQSAAFALAIGSAAIWSLAAQGCVLTYNGPAASFFIRLFASIAQSATATAFAGVSHNNDLTGADVGFNEEIQSTTLTAAQPRAAIATERVVVLAPGDTIRPKFRTTSNGSDMTIENMTISAQAFF